MITTATQLVYSVSAASRILNVRTSVIQRVEVWASVVLVVFHKGHGLRPRFVSRRTFCVHFAEYRRTNRDNLVAYQWPSKPSTFGVHNLENNNRYTVQVTPDAVICECHDYRNQVQLLGGRGVCKHGYEVLAKLGCTSLRAFTESMSRRQLRILVNSKGN